MFKDNLVQMRKMKQMTQEDIAEKVGVTISRKRSA